MDVSYHNLEKILDKINKVGHKGVIFGSWFIPYYIHKEKDIKIDSIGRETADIDLMISNDMLDKLDESESLVRNVGGNSYEPMEIDKDGNEILVEFFAQDQFKDIDPKFSGRLEEYLSQEEFLETISGDIKAPKPWIWVGLKIAAYKQRREEKHRHDLVYLKGMLGDEKFGYLLGELQAHKFEELIDIYKEMLGSK